jgi:glutathione-independent formaldehyde dehydrogenase
VVYKGPGEVAVEEIDYPKLEVPEEVASAMGMSKEAPHAAILRIVSTNICGSDQHRVRGRTTAPPGQTLGHEITGEVIEKGNDVQFIDEGDLCSVPFNIACGRCRNCKERKTGVCLNVNPAGPETPGSPAPDERHASPPPSMTGECIRTTGKDEDTS